MTVTESISFNSDIFCGLYVSSYKSNLYDVYYVDQWLSTNKYGWFKVFQLLTISAIKSK